MLLSFVLVAVNQMCFVRILVRIDLSLRVHNCAVGNFDLSACGQSSNVFVLKLDIKGLGANASSNHIIVGSSNFFSANGNLDGIFVKGQALAHGIVQDVAVVCSLHGNGDLIVDSIADLSGVFGNPVALGVRYLFINVGHFVLLVDGSIGFGGIQTAESTQRSIYQIVAKVETGKANSIAGSSLFFRSGNVFFGCISKCCLGKISSLCTFYPSGVAILKRNVAVTSCAVLEEIFPSGDYSVGVGASGGIIAVQVEHLINGISFTANSFVNGNATSTGSSTTSRPRRNRHGANHSNCQQRSYEFLHCFFHGKSPFLFFAPCRPLRFAQGGGGVVLFGLSRKLCAGRAGAQPRASGREVQFSHLSSLRVCACGG